jgi:hypothetical protein
LNTTDAIRSTLASSSSSAACLTDHSQAPFVLFPPTSHHRNSNYQDPASDSTTHNPTQTAFNPIATVADDSSFSAPAHPQHTSSNNPTTAITTPELSVTSPGNAQGLSSNSSSSHVASHGHPPSLPPG